MPNINIMTRREMEVINKKELRYPLMVAEKDYFLALVSKIVYDSPLRDILVFKGGTALHHCYLKQMRFSEDLDFTSLDRDLKLEDVKKIFEPYDFLSVKKEYVSKATIKIERLTYNGPLGQPNSLKLEIDFIQNVVLPAKDSEYKNIWKVDTKVRTMDIREIAAEKIRATSDRARYRDFYDLFQIFKNFNLDLKEIIGLINQKEVRKPISRKSILSNWKIAKQEKSGEVQRIYYSEEAGDEEIEKMIERLDIGTIDVTEKFWL
ncbi:MAG TPA: nucleotidyl transferase AbiEii/AbiGii toxin family protein [Candidatus Moranbacteria bacterium]|nr:nucleotidyl transferase AbiEii/AbiGii toxin family protein [Candidatus Moranbacteria bacterium]